MAEEKQQIFKLHSEYQPTGDQPQAIAELVKGFQEGNLRHLRNKLMNGYRV